MKAHPNSATSAPMPKNYIMAIAPYVPGRATTNSGKPAIKLSANENPLGCSPRASEAMASEAANMARYPDPAAFALRTAIADVYGIHADQIVCGTGSGEMLNLIAVGYAGVGDEIIHVNYGFEVYPIATRKVGANVVVAPDANYATDVDALLALINAKTRLVYLANPNNPTGTLMTDAEMRRLHAALPADVILVLDQAYTDYLENDGPSAFDLARENANVLVTRTFSKIYGLASERIGWAYGHPDLIATINRIRGPFNVTSAGQAAAIAALADQDFVRESRTHNKKWRDWLNAEISALANHGLRVVPSAANFILVLFEGSCNAETTNRELMDAGYVVRWLPNQGLGHALRITIGTEAENIGFMDTLRAILAKERAEDRQRTA
jgi:histidinol-phosphate aminotransferase